MGCVAPGEEEEELHIMLFEEISSSQTATNVNNKTNTYRPSS